MVGLALRESLLQSVKLTRCSFLAGGSSYSRHITTATTTTAPAKTKTSSSPSSMEDRFKKKKKGKLRNRATDNEGDGSVRDPFNKGENRKPPSLDNIDPNVHRLYFMSPDKIRSLEDAQVFINHIKTNYGPLIQYQFPRCPETNRYFGYGFLTFKEKSSLDKALADGYIRVGLKDFELKQSGYVPSRRRAVIHKKPGFTSFYNLEELRAKKKQEELSKTQGQPQEEEHQKQSVMTGVQANVGSGESSEEEPATQDQQELESSLESSSSSDNSSLSPDQTGPARSNSDSSNKPFYIPLQRKGMAQIWKTITNDLDRERSLNDADNSENLELKDSSIKATSKEDSTTLAETEK
ncbi:hypothetical protein BGX31_007236 [Mortierella sp. GBA43]|nr:hypothetical protein BGX31_007236 [Mortierella sp. GBA43]